MRTPRNPYVTNGFEKERGSEDLAKFYTKSGWLSEYALACGYQEYINAEEFGLTIRLYSEMGNCYSIRLMEYKDDETPIMANRVWEQRTTLPEARRAMVEMLKPYAERLAHMKR